MFPFCHMLLMHIKKNNDNDNVKSGVQKLEVVDFDIVQFGSGPLQPF